FPRLVETVELAVPVGRTAGENPHANVGYAIARGQRVDERLARALDRCTVVGRKRRGDRAHPGTELEPRRDAERDDLVAAPIDLLALRRQLLAVSETHAMRET